MYKCYLNEDVAQLKPFAVKITREDDEEKKQASRNEFELTRNLDHRGMVKSYAKFENSMTGEIHMIMDYF